MVPPVLPCCHLDPCLRLLHTCLAAESSPGLSPRNLYLRQETNLLSLVIRSHHLIWAFEIEGD